MDRIERAGRRWRLRTPNGELDADDVVVATGHARVPFIPAWRGRDRFEGRLLHAAEYRNAEPFRGRDVLVAGCGCSGMEIAHDVSQAHAVVRLSVRTPPNLVLRAIAGVPGDPLGSCS